MLFNRTKIALAVVFAAACSLATGVSADFGSRRTLHLSTQQQSSANGKFILGVNFSGLESQYPQITSTTEISYYVNRNINKFRLPIGWSQYNPTYGVVGIQPAINGPLDVTSTYLPFTPSINYLENSELVGSLPWTKFNASGTLTVTNNAGTGPNGTSSSTLIQATRPDQGYFVVVQPFPVTNAGNYTGSVWVEAADSGSVGKVISINYYTNSGFAQVNATLTNTWQLVQTTASLTSTTNFEILPYGGSSLTGDVNFYVAQPQVNAGTSVVAYQPTAAGYLAAADSIINYMASVGASALVDVHTFGGGPALSGTFSVSSLTSSGTTVSGSYSGAAAPLINGSTVQVYGAADPNYNGYFTLYNVTNSTFQYTVSSAPNSSPAVGTLVGYEYSSIGSTRLPISAFADLWQKISAHYKGNPGVRGYDLMNEWVNGFNSTTIFEAEQAAINAIRANGDTTPIYVEGTNYTGAWNWVTGDGQPYNNSQQYLLVDPLNKLYQSAHSYLDNDSSGTNFSWALETAKPGVSPPGTPTSSTIGPTRLSPFLAWAVSHNVNRHVGETGGSNDSLAAGGNDNFAAWNLALSNEIAFAKNNNFEIDIWGAGPNFGPGYPAYLGPSSTSNPSATDFSASGLQSTLMVVLEKYSGFSGSQPLAYRIDLPVTVTPTANPEAPTVTSSAYGSVGVASGNFTIRYNGVIAAPVTITPKDYLADGVTPAGGTFTPAAVTLAAGDNAISYFTYTPSQSATIEITATNSAGWINPPVLGFSSISDPYHNLPTLPTNLYGMYRRYTPYLGPAVRVQRPSDGAQQDFYYNNSNNLDRTAIQNFTNLRSGIPVATWYDMSPSGNAIEFSGTLPTLNLQNAAGYPELNVQFGAAGQFNTNPNGQTQLSVITRMNQSSSSTEGMFRMDYFNGPLIFGTTGLNIFSTGWIGPNQTGPAFGSVNATASIGAINNAYHEYGVTYTSGLTNGFLGYRDGSQVSQTTATYVLNAAFSSTLTQFGYFKFGSGNWVGSETNLEIFEGYALTLSQLDVINSADAAYYSTPLPDTLPPLLPTINNAANQFSVSGVASHPFSAVTIGDGNTSPTDNVVITLSGYAATLSGTGLSGSNPYTLAYDTPANVTTKLQALALLSTGSVGSTTNIHISVTSSYSTSASTNTTSTISSVTNPVVSGMVAPNVSMDQGAPPLWQITVSDTNPSPMVSASVTVTGASGTLSHLGPTGPSGTGPYTFSADTPANLTRWLRNLLWLPGSTSTGATTTFSVTVTNALGLNATASNTITNVAPQAMPTPFSPLQTPASMINPAGTNRGMNFSGTETTVPQIFEGTYAWAATNHFGTVRWPFLFSNMVKISSGVGNISQLYANFNGTQVGYAETAIEWARKYGQWLKFDDHSYGGILNPFNTGTTDDATFLTWGSDIRTPASGFADLWKRQATYFSLYPNVMIGLQNESMYDHNSNVLWRANATAATTAIRTVLPSVLIELPSASNVIYFDTSVWTGYTDTGPWRAGIHQYFDGAGGSLNTCTSTPVTAYFGAFTTWARANSVKASVSEYAWGTDPSCMTSLGGSIVAYFNANNDVYPDWQWWSGGAFPTSYQFYMGPESGGGRPPPQYSLISPYLP